VTTRSRPLASVVICTRNRAEVLRRTLCAAERLSVPFEWELIVVDNGSSDHTAEIVRDVGGELAGRTRLAHEPVAGLSAARNLGVRLARGGIVAFLDDDALPSPGWLSAYGETLAEHGVASAGGPVEPQFEGELPPWLDSWCLSCLSAWDRGPAPLDLRYIELPRGANVAYRREIFEVVGDFDRRLGRSGRSLRSCEELELGLRIERCGLRTRYVPGAGVLHRVETRRLSPGWMVRRFASQGFSEAIIDWKHFGWSGIRQSWRRSRLELDAARVSSGNRSSLRFQSVRRQWLAYRRGALYAAFMVARWTPPVPPS